MSEAEIRELEKQLSCPSGPTGIEVAINMNKGNIGMTLSTLSFLEITHNNKVLELGHGNGGHLKQLLALAENIAYYGLEISETMWAEARKNAVAGNTKFSLYDGVTIPFEDNFFDRILSVNTVYFWTEPDKLINEIARTLKPGGYVVLTFGDKNFMKALPFVGQRFTLYDKEDMQNLVGLSELDVVAFEEQTEQVSSKNGEQVERRFTMAKLTKKAR